MATDRDRFARVLDKRFNGLAYLLRVNAPDKVERLCDYVEIREREPDKELPALFREAHRVLTRAAPPLFAGHDPEADHIRSQALRSDSAMRLAHAFDEARVHGGDLATVLAERQVRWMTGCLATQPDWADIRSGFADCASAMVAALSLRHRARYLQIGERPVRPKIRASNQSDILNESIPVTL